MMDVSYRAELKKLEDLGECRKKILRDKLNYPSLQSNYVDARMPYTADMGRHELEVQFHILSKESIMPPTIEEEDWVLVENNIPSVEIKEPLWAQLNCFR